MPLGQLLSISLFFNAIDMVPSGILNREKRFLFIAVRSVVVYLISSIVSIVMAFHGYKYYALVAQTILAAILGFLWDQYLTRSQFRVKVDLSSIRKVFSYSGYQFAFNIVNYLSRNLDNLLTGKFIGKVELGYYNKAYSLMLYPVSNLAGVVTPVLHPVLSDYQDNESIIYHKYIQVVRMFACIGLLVAPMCYLASEEIILIVFGNQWSVSGLCFKFLALAILPQMINSGAGAIFQSLGNTKLLFFNCCINTAITAIAICIGIFIGKDVVFLSICVSFAYICHFLTAFYMLIKFGFGYRCCDAVMGFKNELFMLAIMVICLITFPFSINNTMISLIIKTVWVACFYCAGLIITKNYKLLASIFVRK